MIQPGLERIGQLLKNVELSWKSIHVAGTNGKGTVCGFASTFLTRRCINNGCFTSPHLINRWDSILIKDKPVSEQEFRRVEQHFIQLNKTNGIGASEFELLTATAFQLFADKKVEVGVVEVGMGGRLDATNILNNQAISVISKISREHQEFLGNTLEEITLHKAGILRPNVPYIVNPANEWNVQEVIDNYAKEIGAGPRILPDTPELRQWVFQYQQWNKLTIGKLPFQKDNIILAWIAFIESLKTCSSGGMRRSPTRFLGPLKNKVIPGRLQTVSLPSVFGHLSGRKILVDGAHNPDAAEALEEWVYTNLRTQYNRAMLKKGLKPSKGSMREEKIKKLSVTWILAMTEGKDAKSFLKNILRPGDTVVTTTFGPVDGMPWVKPMDPKTLSDIAFEVQPTITRIHIPIGGPFRALCAAKYMTYEQQPMVLTGSLYLVGDTLRLKEQVKEDPSILDMASIDKMEKYRVLTALNQVSNDQLNDSTPSDGANAEAAERRKLQEEIGELDREMQALQVEETRLLRTQSTSSDRSDDQKVFTSAEYEALENPGTMLRQPAPSADTNRSVPLNDIEAFLRGEEMKSMQFKKPQDIPHDNSSSFRSAPFSSDPSSSDPFSLTRPSDSPRRSGIVYPRADTRFEGAVRVVEANNPSGTPVLQSIHPLKFAYHDSNSSIKKPISRRFNDSTASPLLPNDDVLIRKHGKSLDALPIRKFGAKSPRQT